ncbi:ABC transporter substrate-binding protein [Hylemonella gracilis]|jgi:iron complex transport system substrate-binding protein|uniref:ABC transporter substrate-binding protein n=1 Tax=Hylemonella gracilis TaxID=80880 RepID=A0A4P6UJM5_9BURK|nr:helical backbone metal receptor [Hylemonella gracilis]QBK05342.1 ABC transporter substrate-binding protein [Hylemonella gracilis]
MTLRLALAFILTLLMAQAGPARAFEITDQRGVTVRFAQSPQRIVSLLPSLTESVCALGQCQRLVGVDRYSNHPESIARLPRLGGGLDPSIEAVVALRPDVVLLSVSSRAGERLEALGLKVVALEPKTHADVQRVLRDLGVLLDLPAAEPERLWREIQDGVDAAARSLPPAARGTRVYFEVSRGPYGAGEVSFIGETLARLGVKNVIPAELGPFPRLNPEFVVRADPDLIMIGNRSMQSRVPYPGWDQMRAVRGQRLCVYGVDDSDVVVRPGPRMAEAARIMARCIREKLALPGPVGPASASPATPGARP